jgi:hypothetical protein
MKRRHKVSIIVKILRCVGKKFTDHKNAYFAFLCKLVFEIFFWFAQTASVV